MASEPTIAPPKPCSEWDAYQLASLLNAFAEDHPRPRVREAMAEAAKRLRVPASPVPSVEARMTNYALAHELMDTAQWVATLGYRGNADTHVSRIVRAVEHLRGQRYERPANLDDLLRNDPWAAAIASHVHSALRSEAEPSEDTDNADSVALEVLCRVFDDGADEGIEEWREWYGPAEWLHWSRALGAFIRHRLDTRSAARSSSPEDPNGN